MECVFKMSLKIPSTSSFHRRFFKVNSFYVVFTLASHYGMCCILVQVLEFKVRFRRVINRLRFPLSCLARKCFN